MSGTTDVMSNLITRLLTAAAANPIPPFASKQAAGKLYEVKALSRLLLRFRQIPGSAIRLAGANTVLLGPPPSRLTIAGAPASANRNIYNFFELFDPTFPRPLEAWVSVQVHTLSAKEHEQVNGIGTAKKLPAAKHEIDIGLFDAGIPLYPSFQQMHGGFSCKATAKVPKALIRELIGSRRETAYLDGPHPSLLSWVEPFVNADPPSPLVLISSAPKCKKFRLPLESLGIFIWYMRK